ncbi:MAG: hypothetical protein ACE5KE_03530 [Methanosarcinales archaeon]
MLVDSSSIINLKYLGLDNCIRELNAVTQIIEEIGDIEVHQVFEVSPDDINSLLTFLEQIADQTDKQIYVELERTTKYSNVRILNPKGLKGKISLHYGEFYSLARAIKQPEDLLCDDESVAVVVGMLHGICGIELKIDNTFEFLNTLLQTNRISTTDFIDCIETLEKNKLIYFRFPAKTVKDKTILDILIKFMRLMDTQIHK